MSRSSRAIAQAILAALTGALACACSSSPQTATDTADPGGDVVINVGDQQQELQTLLNASGVLAGAPYKVNFVEFDSGPLVDAGFAARRIDVGSMGDLPASLAVKSGLPVVAVMVDKAIGASEYLLAQPGITSIAQLRGEPVAYTTGTAEQAFALRSRPGATVLATIQTVTPPSYGYLLATTAALADKAKLAAIDDLTKRIIEAENWEKSHQSQFITDYYVDVEHQTPQVARLILAAGGTEVYIPITAGVQSALQQMVNLMASSGGLPAAFSVASLFTQPEAVRYNTIVAGVPQNG
jgi:sulfonate transport system substrate-binding protein